MSVRSQKTKKGEEHWTEEISETLDADCKNCRFRVSAILAVALFTLASLVGMAHYQAPIYAYLIASGTGLIFGVLAWYKRWQRPKESG